MKSGSGADDPFADLDGEDDQEEQDEPTETSPEMTAPAERSPAADDTNSSSGSDLPWLYRRDGITDGRQTRQVHLQGETERRESSAMGDLETMLGENVKKADLREAALLVGLSHLDEVADQLREWGYDID